MKGIYVALCLVIGPLTATAQELRIDPSIVRACFDATPPGVVYPACLGHASNACQSLPGGSTTLGISGCIQAETAEWDAILNEQYNATQSMNAAADAAGHAPVMDRSDALRDAQRAWIAFRDADCGARYAMWQDGSIRTVVAANCHLTMTAQRAIDLRDMRGQ